MIAEVEQKSLNDKLRQFIIEKRTALGMSQIDLAVAMYNDKRRQDYISKLENGHRDMNINTLEKFLRVLNADIEIIEY